MGHNPPGTRVTVSAASEEPDAVVISVTDDGAGMPPDLAAAPFEPMRRWRRTRTAGAGLGLSIANGIVAAHGGRMELEQPGRGTRFRIFLPTELPGMLAGDGEPSPVARIGRPAATTDGLVPAIRNGPALQVFNTGEITRDEAGAGDR